MSFAIKTLERLCDTFYVVQTTDQPYAALVFFGGNFNPQAADKDRLPLWTEGAYHSLGTHDFTSPRRKYSSFQHMEAFNWKVADW